MGSVCVCVILFWRRWGREITPLTTRHGGDRVLVLITFSTPRVRPLPCSALRRCRHHVVSYMLLVIATQWGGGRGGVFGAVLTRVHGSFSLASGFQTLHFGFYLRVS